MKPMMMKMILLILFLPGIVLSSNAQSKLKGFTKLVYHSSRCFGSCPQIDMQIDNKRNIYVYRDRFEQTDAVADTVKQFKGVLDVKTYNKLLGTLVKSKYNKLDFPDVTCCDGVITTIIVYVNKKRTYLKSMMPPAEAGELIALLHKIGLETPLKPTNKKIELEE